MHVQECPHPNSCLQEKFFWYSRNWDLQKRNWRKEKNHKGKQYKKYEKIYFKNYIFGKATWEEGIIDKRIGNM